MMIALNLYCEQWYPNPVPVNNNNNNNNNNKNNNKCLHSTNISKIKVDSETFKLKLL